MRYIVSLAIVLAACAAPALAAGGGGCSGVEESAPTQAIRSARVMGADKRVNFMASAGDSGATKSCPSANAACRRNTFVVSGDLVLVGGAEGDWACATFVSPRGVATSGWLPVAQLEMSTSGPMPTAADFAGKWLRTEATLELKAKGADVEVKGDATWGAHDPERVKRGGVNIGEISGTVRPRGNMLAIGADYNGAKAPSELERSVDCIARARLFGRYLVVEDNRMCGGNNVSFTGVYLRQSK